MREQHLLVKKGEIAKYVLLPGDPGRVKTIGAFLDDPKVISQNREFIVLNGEYKGVALTVISTGIGCPSTAIAVEEAINAGAEVLIRVGTCGGAWRKDIPAGSLVIPTACIRDEGTTSEYIAAGFPAVADFSVVDALKNAAEKEKNNYFIGINRTHDAFYGVKQSITKWGELYKDKRLSAYMSPILSSEMEASALFVIASLRGVKAGAVLAVDAQPEVLRERVVGRQIGVKTFDSICIRDMVVKKMILTALEGLCFMAS
ncbi:MAG: nucleoside phosphorylase [Patescibacteria group bacterium]